MEWANKAFPLIEQAMNNLPISLDKMMPSINHFIDTLGTKMTDAINGVFNAITFLKNHFEILGPAVGVVAVIFGTALSVALWSVAAAGWAAISPLLPFIAAVVFIGAEIALLGYMWKTNMFGIRDVAMVVFNYVMGVFAGISVYINSIMPYILQIVAFVWPIISAIFISELTVIWEIVKIIFSNIWNMISWAFTNIFNIFSIVVSYGSGIFKTLLQIVTGDFAGAWETLKTTVQGLLVGIKTFFIDFFTGMSEIGYNLMLGIKDGILNAGPAVLGALTTIGSSMISVFKNLLGIKSPSKVMMEVGFWTAEGLANGIEDGESSVMSSSEKVAKAVTTPYDTGMLNENTGFLSTLSSNSDLGSVSPSNKAPAMPAASFYNSSAVGPTNIASTEINPIINITLNGDGSGTNAQDIAERVKLAIQEVFESAARRQGIAGVQSWQL